MRFWSTTNTNFFFFLLLLLPGFTLQAQENSPYSRYGIGNLKENQNMANRGMGGISLADNSTLVINPGNPATYTGLKLTSYQFGLEGARIGVRNATSSNQTGYASLSYVNVGIPLAKKIGVSFGLIPVSRSKYSMEQVVTLPFSKSLNSYYGGGGTQKIYVGGAYRFGEFSIGVNTGYLFGSLVNTSDNKFEDTLKILSNSITTRTTLGGAFWQLGMHMDKSLRKEYRLKAGLSYTGAQTLRARRETYWQTFFGNVTDPLYTTIVDSVNQVKGNVQLPAIMGAGLLFANGDFWQLGAEASYSDWTTYRSYNNADSMGNSFVFRLGGGITPDVNAVNSYFKRVTYRMGVYTGRDPLRFRQTALSRSAITAGIGFPIRRTNLSIGQINAALEIGRRGTIDNGLLREGFTRFAVGITLNDKWFVKRRYD